MREFQIEDTIIAYMDGRLTDGESAELLHRVSVSPEIRELFEKHVMLRNISYNAARNVSVSAELEEDLFAHIASLQEAERDAVPAGFWSVRKVSMTLGAVAIALVALVGSLEYRTGDAAVKQATVAPATMASYPYAANNGAPATANDVKSSVSSSTPAASHAIASSAHTRRNLESNNVFGFATLTPTPEDAGTENTSDANDASAIELTPQAREASRIGEPVLGPSLTSLRSLQDIVSNDQDSKFEFSLATPITGALSKPSEVPQLNPFATVSLRAAYDLDTKNQVGLRFTAGQFQGLQQSTSMGFTEVSLGSHSGMSGEVLYRHREPVAGLFFVTAGAGYGLYSMGSLPGTLLSGELGFEVPFGNHLLGGFSMIVSNLHQKELPASSAMIFDRGPIYNTLDGRIEYGLTYKF